MRKLTHVKMYTAFRKNISRNTYLANTEIGVCQNCTFSYMRNNGVCQLAYCSYFAKLKIHI